MSVVLISKHNRDGGSEFETIKKYFKREKKKPDEYHRGKKDPTVTLFHGGMFGRP